MESKVILKPVETSEYVDLLSATLVDNPEIVLEVLIEKPDSPSYILASTDFSFMRKPINYQKEKGEKYLKVGISTRGHFDSTGYYDYNGDELIDVIDILDAIKVEYKDYIKDPEVVFYEGHGQGGGNGLELSVKFPDYFAAMSIFYPVTDLVYLYRHRRYLEQIRSVIKRDIEIAPRAYLARSPIDGIANLYTYLFIFHGSEDDRVPFRQSLTYINDLLDIGKDNYIRYYVAPGIGDETNHISNISKSQIEHTDLISEGNRLVNNTPITLPKSGQLVIHGILRTKYFEVKLPTPGRVARIEYNVEEKKIKIFPRCTPRKITWYI